MEGMIRLLLVDDHPVVLGGLRAALEAREGMQVVATAGTLAEAQPFLDRDIVDVALVDLRLPDGSGMELLEVGRRSAASPPIVFLTTFDSPRYPEVAAARGASGFILKTAPIDEIVEVVRIAAAGRVAFTRAEMRPSGKHAWQPLTPRERDIIACVAGGRSNDEIGADLRLSPKTVEWYLSRLFARFDVASRTELATRAEREGWLDLPTERR